MVDTNESDAARVWKKVVGLACLLLAAALAVPSTRAQTSATAQPEMIDEVNIVGLRTLTPAQIKVQLRTQKGLPYNPAIVQEDLTRLGQMKTFQSPHVDVVRTGPNSVKITFIVEEFPSLVREVIYKNAHHASNDDLDGVTNIRRGLPLNPTANQGACRNIVEYYKNEGRFFASCYLEEGGTPGDSRVVFNITEGPIVRVRNINFTGNDTLASSARLRTQIDTWPRFLCIEMAASKYKPAMIDEDKAKIEAYYKLNGYLDARVSRDLDWTDDRQFVDITFHIVEGLRYHVKDVYVEGTNVLVKDQVESILKLKKGDVYDERVINADVRNVQDLYGYRGFPTVVHQVPVFPPDKAADPGVVMVKYEVTERKPFRAGQILISGNDVTKYRVILRMLQFYPGQTLSYPELRNGEKVLASTGFFDNKEDHPSITTIEPTDNPDSEYKDILIHVKETMTGSLMFGASVNSDAGLVGSIVLNEKNFDILRPPTSIDDLLDGRAFRGGGQEFRLEAVPGTEVQRYSATWREPYLLDMPYSLTVSAYYFEREYNEDVEARTGFNVSISHRLNRNWSVGLGLRLENVNISNVPYWAPVDYTSVVGNNFLVAPRVTIARDDRDSVLRPTEGSLIQLTYEELFGEFVSPILTLQASKFFTLWQRADGSGRQVIMLRSTVAWAGDNTPVYERFFAGGINSLRGFAFRGVGVWEVGDNVGGDFMFVNTVEYQLPILANDSLWFVAFVDSGTVESRIGITNYRVSAGFGARIVVPMLGQVPIALDFGFPIVTGPGDQTQLFSFYVGFFHQ
jgi:outer membrane protein assembly complex protein YaeT